MRKPPREKLERAIRAVYDQEVVDMLAEISAKHRPPHSQDPNGELRNRTRLQWDKPRRQGPETPPRPPEAALRLRSQA